MSAEILSMTSLMPSSFPAVSNINKPSYLFIFSQRSLRRLHYTDSLPLLHRMSPSTQPGLTPVQELWPPFPFPPDQTFPKQNPLSHACRLSSGQSRFATCYIDRSPGAAPPIPVRGVRLNCRANEAGFRPTAGRRHPPRST